MSSFQLLAIGLAVFVALTISVALKRRRVGRLAGAFWLLVWLAAATAIAVPETTSLVAQFLGIHRGADLVLYLSILAMMVGFFAVYARLQRLEENLTELVRYLAIRDARESQTAEEDASC